MATPIPTNHATFTLDEIARAIGGEVVGDRAVRVCGVVTDSRAADRGNLYVAIHGANVDGHAFLGDAAQRGAAGAIVRKGTPLPSGLSAVAVDDTLVALGRLARYHRDNHEHPVVAITGSVGKTGTKELIAAALRGADERVHATVGNLNNLVGLPMTILACEVGQNVVMVLELGMNTPGEMARLVEIAQPSVGVLTSIADVHTAGVGGIEGVEREKAVLLSGLFPTATAIANGDDDRCLRALEASPAGKKLTFGTGERCDVRIVSSSMDAQGKTRGELKVAGRTLSLELSLIGAPAMMAAAAAIAVAHALGEDLDTALEGLRGVTPTPGRLCPIEGPDNVLVIDDSYNASPIAVAASIRTASELATRRGAGLVLVLGDMRELENAEEHHAEIGRVVAKSPARAFIAVGTDMVHAARTAMRSSRTIEVHRVRDADDAIEALEHAIERGDVVLIKGSRSMKMERVVSAFTRSALSNTAEAFSGTGEGGAR